MKVAGLRLGDPGGGPRAEQRFAIAGLFLAVAAALTASALVRGALRAEEVPSQIALLALACAVALGLVYAGFVMGRRLEPPAIGAVRDARSNAGQRRLWEEQLTREVHRATRAKMPLSLALVDVVLPRESAESKADAREAALAFVGDVLGSTCRSRDLVARLGSDGFAILLPRTHAAEARVAAERVRERVAERRSIDREGAATVAIGISDLSSIDQPHAQLLWTAAGRALQTAKYGGRDRVEIGNGKPAPRSSSTVVAFDPRRRSRKRSSRRTS